MGDLSPPSFVKKPAPWTFCADFIQKDVADIDGEVFYELSAKTAKGFVWSFHTHVLMIKHFWEPMGCDLVCICGIKLHSHKAETQCLLRNRPESLARLKGHARNYVKRHEAGCSIKDELQQQ